MSKRRDTPPSPFRIVVTRQGVATIEQHMDTMCYVPHVVLSAEQWGAIAAAIQAVITAQRKKYGQRRGKWTSPIPLDRQEGKEVLVLAYGIERADVALIGRAILNWKGLHPEERRWLCTQTMAVRDHPWARRWVALTSLERWIDLPARLQEGEAVFRRLWDLAIEHHGSRGVSFEGDISAVPFVEQALLPAPHPLLVAHS